jgi:hypothetical protein
VQDTSGILSLVMDVIGIHCPSPALLILDSSHLQGPCLLGSLVTETRTQTVGDMSLRNVGLLRMLKMFGN